MKADISLDFSLVQELLDVLGFRFQEHKNLVSCLNERLNEEKYANVMRGIVLDSKDLEDVQKIIEAYEKLKPLEEEILSGTFFLEAERKNSTLDAFVVRKYQEEGDWKTQVLKKNEETDEYEEIFCGPSSDVKVGCYIKDNRLFNFQGDCLLEMGANSSVYQINDNIVVTFLNHALDYYVSLDGTICLSVHDFPLNIFQSLGHFYDYPDDVEDFFRALSKNKNLPYLDKNILAVRYGYICCQDKNSIYFYTYDGTLIVSSDDKYCYLEATLPLEKEDKRHIIRAARLNSNLDKVYGYYDLDKRREVSTFIFDEVYPWTSYGGYGISDDTMYTLNQDGQVVSHLSYSDIKNLKKGTLYLDFPVSIFLDNSSSRTLSSFLKNNTCYYIKKLTKISDFLYIANYEVSSRGTGSNHLPFQESHFSLLVSNIDGAFKVISRAYKNIDVSTLESGFLLAKRFSDNYSCSFVKLFLSGMEEEFVFKNTFGARDATESSSLPLKISSDVKNSLFLDSKYKDIVDAIECEDKMESNSTIYELSHCAQKFYLSEASLTSINSKNLDKNAKGVYCAETALSNLFLVCVRDTKNYVLVSENGEYFSYGDGISSVHLDCFGHILLEIPYNNSSRWILVDCMGNVLIDTSLSIELVDAGYYIVRRNDSKCQIFDQNGILLSIPCDDASVVEKFFVNSRGRVVSNTKKLTVDNGGYIYLLDDTHDYLIQKNVKYNDLLNKVKMLVKEGE